MPAPDEMTMVMIRYADLERLQAVMALWLADNIDSPQRAAMMEAFERTIEASTRVWLANLYATTTEEERRARWEALPVVRSLR